MKTAPDESALELRSAFESCVLVDRSNEVSRLIARGPDTLDLLNRLSTADLTGLPAGEGRVTVLTSAKGRIVERLFVHRTEEDEVWMFAGPDGAPRVVDHLGRYTFRERIAIENAHETTRFLALVGPSAAEALRSAGVDEPRALAGLAGSIEDHPVRVLGHDGVSGEGFAVLVATAHGPRIRSHLLAAVERVGGRAGNARALETYRILCGLPVGGRELTEDYNPLEAGQLDAVSFDKGCYVGQEVVARLRTYDKVSRCLVGLELPDGPDGDEPQAGTPLFADGSQAGRLTSCVVPPGSRHAIGLGYLKRRALRPDLRVSLGAADSPRIARVLELPFPYTGYLPDS